MKWKKGLLTLLLLVLLSGCSGLAPKQKQHVIMVGLIGAVGGAAMGWAFSGGAPAVTTGGAILFGGLMMGLKSFEYQAYNDWYQDCRASGYSHEYCHRKALKNMGK